MAREWTWLDMWGVHGGCRRYRAHLITSRSEESLLEFQGLRSVRSLVGEFLVMWKELESLVEVLEQGEACWSPIGGVSWAKLVVRGFWFLISENLWKSWMYGVIWCVICHWSSCSVVWNLVGRKPCQIWVNLSGNWTRFESDFEIWSVQSRKLP